MYLPANIIDQSDIHTPHQSYDPRHIDSLTYIIKLSLDFFPLNDPKRLFHHPHTPYRKIQSDIIVTQLVIHVQITIIR